MILLSNRTKLFLIRFDLYREPIKLRRRLCHKPAQTVVLLFLPDSAFVAIVEQIWKLSDQPVSMEGLHHRVFHRHNRSNHHMHNRNMVNNNTSNTSNISSRKSPISSGKRSERWACYSCSGASDQVIGRAARAMDVAAVW